MSNILFLAGVLMGALSAFGVTAGAHRLWTHRSYKAKWPLRVILVICYSIAGQVSFSFYENFLSHGFSNKNVFIYIYSFRIRCMTG